jgi:hypothetical protein
MIKADTSLCKYNVKEEESTEIPTILKKSSIQRQLGSSINVD